MTATDLNDPAPDWAGRVGELHCPLCQYNLRGLEQPRCPECGLAFSWLEILRGEQEIHPYLFEHQNRRNTWSFWKTYWTDCRPRKFWSELSPAQPVKLRRLMIYWFIASLTMFAAPLAQFGIDVWDEFRTLSNIPVAVRPVWIRSAGSFGLRMVMPPPPPPPTLEDYIQYAWQEMSGDVRASPLITGSLTVLAWPWLTLLCLLIFSESMRRARILKRHVLRVVIYGTDFGFLLLVLVCAGKNFSYGSGWPIIIELVCAALTLYRVYFGYLRYLRFHMPFATVLSSQIMVFLLLVIVYFQTIQRW